MRDIDAEPQGNLEALNDRPTIDPADDAPQGCSRVWDTDEGRAVCAAHGSFWQAGGCLTRAVLDTVAEHRQFQFENYGPNRDLPNGTGPRERWIPGDPRTAYEIEGAFRADWDFDVDPDPAAMTWLRLLREEVAEVFAQGDDRWLEGELVQVAALAVSWVEKIRERSDAHD